MKDLRDEFLKLKQQRFSKLVEIKLHNILNECKCQPNYPLFKEVCEYLDKMKVSIKYKVVCEDALEIYSIGQFLFKHREEFKVDDEFYSEEEALEYIQKESSEIEEPFKDAWLFFVIVTKGKEIIEIWSYNTDLVLLERVC